MSKIYRKNCENCGKPYSGQGKRFCSRECSKTSDFRRKDWASKEKLEKMYKTMTIREIAKVLDSNYTTIRRWLITYGIERNIQRSIDNRIKNGQRISPKTEFKKGQHPSTKTEFKKRQTPWNKNKPYIQIRGKKHFNWVGGRSRYRGLGWEYTRKQVWKRDGYKCKSCGKDDCRLDAHHIVPYRISKDNSMNNLITLCTSCHTRTENLYFKLERRNKSGKPNSELYCSICFSGKNTGKPRIDARDNGRQENTLHTLTVECNKQVQPELPILQLLGS